MAAAIPMTKCQVSNDRTVTVLVSLLTLRPERATRAISPAQITRVYGCTTEELVDDKLKLSDKWHASKPRSGFQTVPLPFRLLPVGLAMTRANEGFVSRFVL